MQRFLRRRPELLMGTFVLVVALGAALFRAADYVVAIGPEPTPVTATVSADADTQAWFDTGMALWDARCYGCHADVPYVSELFVADGGREYLIDLMLYGAQGEAEIFGAVEVLRHRAYGDAFDDDEMSALLNLMLVAWGNDEALPPDAVFYTPDEVGAARGRDVHPSEVIERRPW